MCTVDFPTRLQQVLGCLILAVAMLFLAACIAPTYRGNLLDPPLEVPGITGTDHRDRIFDSNSLDPDNPQVLVVFFGYTFCPDYCPALLNEIQEAYTSLPQYQDRISVLFVTVDPERDTPERLAAYMSAFHDDFRAIRIDSVSDFETIKLGYGIYIESHQEAENDQHYLVDHTVRTFVLDSYGRLALTYLSDLEAGDLARDLRQLLRQ